MIKHYLSFLLFGIVASAQQNCTLPGDETGNTGCVTLTYLGAETTYSTVRTANGKIWLQQNLGSQQVATSATDEASYGDLFQWGRWDDGHQRRNSDLTSEAASPNNPLGLGSGNPRFISSSPAWWADGVQTDEWTGASPNENTANKTCDPCKALGNNWSLPTQTDWEEVIAAEEITNVASAYESSLRLSVAGSRLESGSSNFTGVRGYYWSKTTSDYQNYGKYLYYSNFIVNPSAGSARSQGISVRCIYAAPDYCAVSVDEDVEPITSVEFAGIDNQSSEVVNGTPALEDFTNLSAQVQKGQTYTLKVQGNTVGEYFEHDIRTFIDWNQDGTFDMETEYYYANLMPSTGTDGVEAIVDITVPTTASLGTTRMRIIKDMWNVYEEGDFDACLNAYYGQVEEYSVVVSNSLSTEAVNKNQFVIFPNPTLGLVSFQSSTEIATASVYDMTGRFLAETKSASIDLSQQPSGIYIVKISFADGTSAQQKIVRQ